MEQDSRKEGLEEALKEMGERMDDFKQKRDEPKKRYAGDHGLSVAESILDSIEHTIKRSVLVGSLGREANYTCDIDILVEPWCESDIKKIRIQLEHMGKWKRGGERMMSVDNVFNSGLTLDLFLCHPPAQWGVLTAVRLNPAPLVIHGKKIIDEMGLTRRNASVFSKSGEVISLSTEAAWFELIGIPFVSPSKRWELTRDLRLI